MITRVLPREEWPRLEGTEAETAWPHFNPENTRVLVVEDEGKIIGTWTMLRTVHAECLWIAPGYRGSFGVAKRLLKEMRKAATAWGALTVVTGSISKHVSELILRFGGEPVPCESYVLPVNGLGSRRVVDRELGRYFHRQLATQIEDPHPDDDQHDERVGRALRTAIRDHSPETAMADYNAWAVTAGYEPIRYLGMSEGRMRADIVTAIVEVDEEYAVRVVEQEALCQQRQ